MLGGKYRLLRTIARSGEIGGVADAADVFEAEHAWTGKHFTLKVLASAADDQLETRFVREARAASALVHPNVVKVYDVDRDPPSGLLYQVQELLDGESFESLLARVKRLPLETALDRLLPVMDALALAHDVGVVHRDVRPGTIFLSRRHDGEIVPKLIDFGVSKLLDATAGPELEHSMTVNNAAFGRPAYLSPERLVGTQIDASIDVWAMAVTLYEALAGTTPFKTPSFTDMAIMVATRDAPHLWERAPEVRPDVAAVIDRALLRKRADRIADMTVLVAELCVATGRELPEKAESLLDALAPVEVDTDGMPTPLNVQRPVSSKSSRPSVRATEQREPRIRLGVVGDPDTASSGEARDGHSWTSRAAVVRVPTYADLVDALAQQRVDVAWLAPMAYARAKLDGAVGLFQVARHGLRDPRALLVGRAPRVTRIEEAAGARAVWIDPWSTSGYALQRRELVRRGIDLTSFSAQAFLGSQEAIVTALMTGRADLGGLVGMLERGTSRVRGPWPEGAPIVVLAISEQPPPEVIAVGPSRAGDAASLREVIGSIGVAGLSAAVIGTAIEGTFARVDEASYASLLDRESLVM
jgi:serine/threonine-protein kinase